MGAITISAIIRATVFAVWSAKARFQQDLERSLTKIEAAVLEEESLVGEPTPSNKIK